MVDRIDRAGRTVSITSAGVALAPIYAGPDMPIFDQLNSGDMVYDSVIVEVTPRDRMKPIEDITSDARKMVERADASILQQSRLASIRCGRPATSAACSWRARWRPQPTLPIVLTTGYVDAAAGLRAGEFALLPKPFTLELPRARRLGLALLPS